MKTMVKPEFGSHTMGGRNNAIFMPSVVLLGAGIWEAYHNTAKRVLVRHMEVLDIENS